MSYKQRSKQTDRNEDEDNGNKKDENTRGLCIGYLNGNCMYKGRGVNGYDPCPYNGKGNRCEYHRIMFGKDITSKMGNKITF